MAETFENAPNLQKEFVKVCPQTLEADQLLDVKMRPSEPLFDHKGDITPAGDSFYGGAPVADPAVCAPGEADASQDIIDTIKVNPLG